MVKILEISDEGKDNNERERKMNTPWQISS